MSRRVSFLGLFLSVIFFSPNSVNAGELTLPFYISPQINSYFDHTSPNYSVDGNITIHNGEVGLASNGNCGGIFGSPISYYTLPGSLGNCLSYDGHDGIDFDTNLGDPIIAVADGVVTFAGCSSTCDQDLGRYVKLWHSVLDLSTIYGHLQDIATTTVYAGATVQRGQLLGWSDSTGASTGDHLHFSVKNRQNGGKSIDPYGWSGIGTDPWPHNKGYLWTTCPPSLTPPSGIAVSGCGSTAPPPPPPPPGSGTNAPVSIAVNTTWTLSDSPYIISNSTTVSQGATLTIQPGVVVKFKTGARLQIYGSLIAHGNLLQKIFFTSFKDDFHGGDTNGDGSATSPASQDFSGIEFREGSTGNFTQAIITYGGGGYGCCYNDEIGALRNLGGVVTIKNSRFNNNYGYGIYQKGGFANGGSTTVVNTVFTGNTQYGFKASNFSQSGTFTLTDSKFGNNGIYDGEVGGITVFINSGNKNTTSGRNGFLMKGLQFSETWNPGIPFIVGENFYSHGQDVELTLNAGVIVKILSGYTGSLTFKGNLYVLGNADDPIYITSIKDDSVGGDTNGDGGATIPAVGDYKGLVLLEGSNAVLTHVVFIYGGKGSCCPNTQGMFQSYGSTVHISNSFFGEAEKYGFYQESTFTAKPTAVIDTTQFINTGDYGIYTKSGTTTIQNSIFAGTNLASAYLSGIQKIFVAGNSAIGNNPSGFWIEGALNEDSEFHPGIPLIVSGPLYITSGKNLTLYPGTIVKFKPGIWPVSPGIDVQNESILRAEGTSIDKIYFTSYLDDIGGDSNGDRSSTTPTAEYTGLNLNSGATGIFKNVVFSYGGKSSCCPEKGGVVRNLGGTLLFENTIFKNNGIGIYRSAGTTTALYSSFLNNTTYGVKAEGSISYVQTVNNWWGSPSGPYHATLNPNGTGNEVLGNINFTPWLTSDPN